jgi:hypothetical protein
MENNFTLLKYFPELRSKIREELAIPESERLIQERQGATGRVWENSAPHLRSP